MTEYLKLAALLLPIVVLFIGLRFMLAGYNPKGDRCPHGKVMPEEYPCAECGEATLEDAV